MGYGRVYVHVPSGFDYDAGSRVFVPGASFVTTGPMVRVHRNDSKIDVQIDADGPVESIEWIVNGHAELVTPTSSSRGPDGPFHTTLHREVPVRFDVVVSGSSLAEISRRPLAIWSLRAVWFDVAGHPIKPSAKEQEFLIRRMETERSRSRDVLSPGACRNTTRRLKRTDG